MNMGTLYTILDHVMGYWLALMFGIGSGLLSRYMTNRKAK